MNIPGFTAEASLLSRPTRIYQARAYGSPSGISPSVLPQAFRGSGGFGGFGGLGALDPLPPECSQCQWTCMERSCGPGCRYQWCGDVCTSVPCAIG